jgi:hypothetical protein
MTTVREAPRSREAQAVSCGTAPGLSILVYFTSAALTLSPLLWASVPPLVDYPNHLARMWILVNAGRIPELASNYAAHWRLLPNLAMDLIVPALALVMPVELAGRLFIALTMLALLGGTVALHRALQGRVGLWPLCSLLFIYNTALFWGLLNFLFGAGAYLLAFSGWIATRHWRIAPRIAAFSAIATLLFILHLFAFGLYGLSIMSYELGSRLRQQGRSIENLVSWVLTGLQFIPAIGLWLWLLVTATGAEPTYTAYGSVIDHIYALIAPVTFGKPAPIDIVFIACFGLFVIYVVNRRSLKILPEMRLPLLVLAVAAILIPNWLSGSWLADVRLPVILPFVFIASTRLERAGGRVVRLFATAAVVLLATRVWAISETWYDYDLHFAEFRATSRVIPRGARLLFVEGTMPEAYRQIPSVPAVLASRWERTFSNMEALAVIDRAAFIPGLFLTWTPVSPTARNAGLFSTSLPPPDLTPEMLLQGSGASSNEQLASSSDRTDALGYWQDWPKDFDFVLWIDFGRPPPSPVDHLQLSASGSFFRIYRVLRPTSQ